MSTKFSAGRFGRAAAGSERFEDLRGHSPFKTPSISVARARKAGVSAFRPCTSPHQLKRGNTGVEMIFSRGNAERHGRLRRIGREGKENIFNYPLLLFISGTSVPVRLTESLLDPDPPLN